MDGIETIKKGKQQQAPLLSTDKLLGADTDFVSSAASCASRAKCAPGQLEISAALRNVQRDQSKPCDEAQPSMMTSADADEVVLSLASSAGLLAVGTAATSAGALGLGSMLQNSALLQATASSSQVK